MKILLFIIGFPLLELYVLIKVGGMIGATTTILLTALTAITGILLVRFQAVGTAFEALREVSHGKPPVFALFSSALLAIAGVCLLIPGFISDAIGFLLLIPPVRRVLFRLASRWVKRKVAAGEGVVIEAKYRDLDED